MTDQLTDVLQRELDAARAELQDLTYRVSHDLRAPLRHIHAYAQVIREDWADLPAEVAGHLGTIQKSAQLLTQQLEGLTQLARIGQQTLSLQTVDVAAMAQELAAELVLRYPNTPVQWQLATDVPLVCADALLLRQVWLQVLDNALKFSRQRTPAQITLTWQLADAALDVKTSQCQISLQDNGVGFASGQEQALFKVFGKLHPAREFDGLGLGLLGCRKIMQRLGGSIGIAGQLNAGCCVTLSLPLATADARQTCCA
jgi:light-regulated signal transduction histidine kinase (bacteriophytochrome)